jgi:nitrate reductase NapAB chaperone NapD
MNKIINHTRTLEVIINTDQHAINDFKAGKITSLELAEINRKNVDLVKQIISEIGFPTINLTSRKAYKAAVLVVLHSEDIDLLNQSIESLQKIDWKLIEKRDIGFMIDKARVIQKRPQLYGTQYRINSDLAIEFIEIEKPELLEQRRAALGMESFDEYIKVVEKSNAKVTPGQS